MSFCWVKCTKCGAVHGCVDSATWKCADCENTLFVLVDAAEIPYDGYFVCQEDHPRISRALGVTQKELDSGEAYKRHPGAEFTPEGYMLIHNRQEKLLRIKQAGMMEFN